MLIQGGSPPDVIDFPQPGLLRTLAAEPDHAPRQRRRAHQPTSSPAGRTSYTVDGEVKALPWRANVKSTVWYSPAAFEEGGYEIPETLEELTALSDQIVADGGIPWCAGIESGVATGWPITDWFEDFMLRINGPEVYDQWVNHEIPFNDPQVLGRRRGRRLVPEEPRLHRWRQRRQGDRHDEVPGRRRADRHRRLLHAPPGELLLDAVPRGHVTVGPPDSGSDITLFYLPVAEAGDPKVMLGAGDLIAAGTDKPETWDIILYASSAEYAVAMANGHAELSPRNDIDPSLITDPLLASFAELLASSEVFRFDGADMMPGAVGSGTFWTEATAWIVGGSTEDMLDNIEASWPAS